MTKTSKTDFNSVTSYKNCSKKMYEIYVCMPPKDTVVINKLEQADVVKALNGREYFTVEELQKMQSSGDSRFNFISQAINAGKAYLVSDKTPFVLCGTCGELWTIGADKLAKTYTFLQNGQVLHINQRTLQSRMKGEYLDWTVVRTSQQATIGQNMACFVPVSQKGQIKTSWGAVLNINGAGVSHGKGDFVVCSKLPNGQPNLGDRWVVNGEIFATTYNNQGWTEHLKLSGVNTTTIDKLPRLFTKQQNNDTSSHIQLSKEEVLRQIKERSNLNVLNDINESFQTQDEIASREKYRGYLYNAFKYFEDNKLLYINGFYTSQLQEAYLNPELNIDRNMYPDGNFLLSARLFIFALGHIIQSDSKFFELHPVDTIKYDKHNGMFVCSIALKDQNYYQVFGCDGIVELRMGKGDKTTMKLKVTKAMLDECYTIIDSHEKRTYGKEISKAFVSEAIYFEFSKKSKLYSNIMTGFKKFTKPRKPSQDECVEILKETCRAFTLKIESYGINILTPFKFAYVQTPSNYDDITIDGDNDNHLALHFKLETSADSIGIKISGKTDKNVLNYTYGLVSNKTYRGGAVKEETINKVTTKMIEKDICGYLGVSRWKRFCTKQYITENLPLKATWTTPDSERRSRIVTFSCNAFNTKFKFKHTIDSLLISSKSKGSTQTVNGKLEGDITPNTVTELNNIITSMAFNGIENDSVKQVIKTILEYKSNSRTFTSSVLLSRLTKIEGNTLYFSYKGYDMTSSVLPDGTVRSECYCIDDKYKVLPIAQFPEAIQVFVNMSSYLNVH